MSDRRPLKVYIIHSRKDFCVVRAAHPTGARELSSVFGSVVEIDLNEEGIIAGTHCDEFGRYINVLEENYHLDHP